MSASDDRFRAQFNRYLGNRTGRPSVARPAARRRRPRNTAFVARNVARGDPSVPASVRSSYKRMAPPGAASTIGVSTNPQLAQAVFQSSINDIIGDWNAAANQAIAADRAMAEARVQQAEEGGTVTNANQVIAGQEEPEVDRSLWGGIWNAIGGNDLLDNFSLHAGTPGRSFQDSLMGRAFNLAGRPFQGSAGALTALAGSEEGDTLYNAWRGLSGQEQFSGGGIYEAYKENPSAPGGGWLRTLEEEHPSIESWISRGAGALFEVGADPLNWAAPALPKIIRGEGALAGEVGSHANLVDNMVDIGETEARNLYHGSAATVNANPVYRNNPQLFIDRINSEMTDLADDVLLNVQQGGSRHTAALGGATADVVGQRWEQATTNAITDFSKRTLDDIWDASQRNAIHPATVQAAINNQPDVKEFFDIITDYLRRKRVPAGSLDEVMDAITLGEVPRAKWIQAWEQVVEKYHAELMPYTTNVMNNHINPTYRTIGIRIGNKEIPFKLPGKMYDRLRTGMGNTRIGEAASHTARAVKGGLYEHAYPGRISNISTRSRAYGMIDAQDFADRLDEVAAGFSTEQRRAIHDALGDENFAGFGDAHMDDGYNKARDLYNEILYDEYANGARSPVTETGAVSSAKQDNYHFIYNKGGRQGDRTLFKTERKNAFNNRNVVGPGEWDMAKARAMGLKPEEDAFTAIWYRYLKSRRDIIRAKFTQDLIDNYAVLGDKPIPQIRGKSRDAILAERNIVKVPYTRLNESYRQAIDATGGAFYIPREVDQFIKNFHELTGWSSADMGVIGRNYAKVIDVLKATVTLPNVGFQVRNFMGDTAMGLLDGVPVHLYSEVGRKYLLSKAGKMPNFRIAEGIDIEFKQLLQMFREDANTGFITSDMSTYGSRTAGRVIRRTAKKGVQTVRQISETRELIPRFTHYLHALREEAQALYKSGMRDTTRILEQARDAALWRVNHYKFDYGALMPWERKLKTLAIPFYTYLRKALPTVWEQLYMNPKWFGRLDRLMSYYDGSQSTAFNDANIPQWIKNMGFMNLTDEPNPLVFTPDFLPTGSLDMFSQTSGSDFFRSFMTKLNPLMQVPIEQTFGRTIYGDMPTEDSYAQYGMGKLPIIGDIAELTGRIPGTPWGTDKPWEPLDLINDRFAGLGLPVRRVSQGQQLQQLNTNIDDYIEAPMIEYNRSQDTYSVSLNEQGMSQVTNKLTGQVMGTFPVPQAAIAFARRLPGNNYQAPTINPLQPLNYQVLSGG